MRKSIQAGILWASLLAAVTLPAYATNVPFTNFQGAWASSTTYAAGAVVTYEGSTYVALQSSRTVTPLGHATKWGLLPSLPVALAVYDASPIGSLAAYPGTLVLQTDPVPTSDWYYFNATALVFVDVEDVGVYCYVSYGERGAVSDGVYGGLYNPFTNTNLSGQAAVADFWYISAGDVAQLYCYSQSGDAASEVLNSSMTVTQGSSPVGSGNIEARPEVRPHVAAVKNK